jgi:D-sedoheptulose 7-phosphate isomerase
MAWRLLDFFCVAAVAFSAYGQLRGGYAAKGWTVRTRKTMYVKHGVSSCCVADQDSWAKCVQNLETTLNRLETSDRDCVAMACDATFAQFKEATEAVRGAGRVIYLIGNGASASMASHFAADLAKNAHVHTQVFTDISLLTAVANDLAYDQIFVEPLRRRMREGDMLVCISSSGNSPNVVNAAVYANQNGGTVVTLSAMDPGNALRALGAINFWVPATTYGLAETAHAAILHYWMDTVSLRG